MFYLSCSRSSSRAAARRWISPRSLRAPAAFTLLELLLVIALLAALTAAMVSAGQRASTTSATARARSELAVLRLALEEYRRRHGDYPRTGDAANVLQALLGKQGPLGAACSATSVLELAKFNVTNGADPATVPTARIVDPWGQPYEYAYRTEVPWTNADVVLYSIGPDGRNSPTLTAGGYPQRTADENIDNIYAGGGAR